MSHGVLRATRVGGAGQPGLGAAVHIRHRWETIEAIGQVVTQRCEVCGKTRVRVGRRPPRPPDPAPRPPTP